MLALLAIIIAIIVYKKRHNTHDEDSKSEASIALPEIENSEHGSFATNEFVSYDNPLRNENDDIADPFEQDINEDI